MPRECVLVSIIQRSEIDKQCTVGRLGFTIVVRITDNGFERLADNFFVAAKARQGMFVHA
jgi:hypothetical protein